VDVAKKLYLCDVSFIATVKLPIEADSIDQAAEAAMKRLEFIAVHHGLDPRLVGTVRYAADPACDPESDVEPLPQGNFRQCANCEEWFYPSNLSSVALHGPCCCHHCYCQKNSIPCEPLCKLCAP
jgi:hypothetical protein